ncbi:hypothetical protein [Henriciella sp.]|uniref:hypothetical protein n=1 Tax=Henriciella sp. TaxID=1968823 RepID=UPI002610F1AD|nr:hypothetical protein [Henriciella sp.]
MMSHTPFIETDRFKTIAERVAQELQRQLKSDYGDWDELHSKQFGIDINPAVVSTLIDELQLYYDAYVEWRDYAENLKKRQR